MPEQPVIHDVEIAVIGAGIVGIATAYYLAAHHRRTRLLVIDAGQPMTLTSAQSGENYRNWWPHPTMTAFTNHSIDLMENLARASGNRFRMTRRGYVLATRDAAPEALIRQLHVGYGDAAEASIRIHDGGGAAAYRPAVSADWEGAPDGVDVLLDRNLIRRTFPGFDPEVAAVLHIRRAGDISGQQLGQHMLKVVRAAGGRLLEGSVETIRADGRFTLGVRAAGGAHHVRSDILVNAAGPFAAEVSALHGEALPLLNVLQQKIAFPDKLGAISRQMPFAIDLDGQTIAWTAEERETLAADRSLAWLTRPMPGGIHCRPDGGERGTWIKLGWAFNTRPAPPSRAPELDPHFPDIVLRGASRLHPSLARYIGRLPRERTHYGGCYTMTEENWPLIGAARTPGVFLAAALSGYGTMSACAAGDLCARAIVGAPLPAFAGRLSLARYDDRPLMAGLTSAASRGVL